MSLKIKKQDLEKDTNHAGLKAKRLIRKFVKDPEENYEPNVQRPKDFIISDVVALAKRC